MKRFLVIVLFMISALNVFAYEVNLNFDVLSQGSDMYPCNAGVGEPADVLDSGSNMVSANVADYFNPGDNNIPVFMVKSSTGPSPVGFSNSTNGAYDQKISDVTFLFNSVSYGARFFVEICFRSPDFVSEDTHSSYQLAHGATFANLIGDYVLKAELRVEVSWLCNDYSDLVTNILTGVENLHVSSALTGSSTVTYDGVGTAIKKCRIHYEFIEQAATLRDISGDNSTVSTSTSIYRVE